MRALRRLWNRLRRRSYGEATESAAGLPALPSGVGGRFSFVTSAYDTPPEFLRELADTIEAQNEPGAEWVIVDNGSTAAATRDCLTKLRELPGVRLLRLEANAGILGGMLAGLQAATRDFVIPVDSDDLVAPYTLRALGHALLERPGTKFLFSDEDHYTAGRRVNPFYRIGWDPALALACSYIWHLCAFDREAALQLGCYTDPGANYCHDWDTLLRFVRAGHRPCHVPAVLYSWRTHERSTTNNADAAHDGSLNSQRHVLQLHLRKRGLAELFEVTDCPLWRGAPELRLRRVEADLPAVCRVESVAELRAAAAAPPFAVLLVAPGVVVTEPDAVAELVGWLELLPEVVIAGGRRLDEARRVLSAGDFPTPDGALAAPDCGLGADDPGYLAMALKPRVVAAVPSGAVLVRGNWLSAQFARLDGSAPASLTEVVARLCALAADDAQAVVCSPFVSAVGAAEREPPPVAVTSNVGTSLRRFSSRGVWHGAHAQP